MTDGVDGVMEAGVKPELVTVPSWNPFVVREMRDGPATFPIEAELYRPGAPTGGRLPAVVVSEGLGGLKAVREKRYGAMLAEAGYVALVIDSFKSRGVARHGDAIRAIRVTEAMMLADAFAGLRYLAARAEVAPERVSIIGFSYGGMITVLSAYEQLAALFLPDGPRFAAHVSYYGCSIPRLDEPRTSGAPVTMLLGSKDGNVSLPRSEAIAEDLRRGGSPVAYTVFDGVYHQWDGDDVERRWVPFNLTHCRVRLGPDDEMRDERTGMRIAGAPSRTALIATSTSLFGYTILQNKDATRRSDEMLFEALART